MPQITLGFSLLLILQGLYSYFGSPDYGVEGAKVSVTALIPAFVGVPLGICGLFALKENLRMHAMHGAVTIGLLGALAAWGRGLSKIGALFSSETGVDKRPITMVLIMAVICTVYVVLCVQSFIAARKRQKAAAESTETADE